MMRHIIKISLLTVILAGLIYMAGCSNEGVSKMKNEPIPENIKSDNTKKSDEYSGKVEHLTSATFKQKVFNYDVNKEWKYEGDLPAIVDFYADWCAPCKRVAPIMEELAREYSGKIRVYKVDTDNEQQLAAAFGIQSIPSILFIPKDGQPQMSMGAMQKADYVKAINELLIK